MVETAWDILRRSGESQGLPNVGVVLGAAAAGAGLRLSIRRPDASFLKLLTVLFCVMPASPYPLSLTHPPLNFCSSALTGPGDTCLFGSMEEVFLKQWVMLQP